MESKSLWDRIVSAFRPEREAEAEPARPAALPPPEVPAFNFDDERIPDSSRDRVGLIRSLSADLEARTRQSGFVQELVELERLRTTHLPKLLQSYIDIPPEHRAQVFRETGRSASYLLNERLDKMINRLKEMSANLAQGQLDAFTQNISFIDKRYGPSPFD